MKNLHRLSLFLSFSSIASASFNLNTSGPDWDYTAKDLANTTSQTCKDAYSANIDCDPTLLGIVASMRPAFKPTSSDLDRTCTSACNASLVAYVESVQKACTAPGDKAQESVGGGDNVDMYLDPVEIVGQIFQYTFASSCGRGYVNIITGLKTLLMDAVMAHIATSTPRPIQTSPATTNVRRISTRRPTIILLPTNNSITTG